MASRSVNKVILLGRLGKDAQTSFTPSGVAKTVFTLATDRRVKDQQTGDWKDETDWHNIVFWRAENVANYLTKGKQVYIEGRIQTRSYDDKEGNRRYITEVVAEEVILLGGRDSGGGGGAVDEFSAPPPARSAGPRPTPMQQRPQPAPEPDFDGPVTDDDVPF